MLLVGEFYTAIYKRVQVFKALFVSQVWNNTQIKGNDIWMKLSTLVSSSVAPGYARLSVAELIEERPS